VQAILGHKSFMATLRYAHLAPELRSEAVAHPQVVARWED
jgi:hypothetical protein